MLYLAKQSNGNFSVWSDLTKCFVKKNISSDEAKQTKIKEKIDFKYCLNVLKTQQEKAIKDGYS